MKFEQFQFYRHNRALDTDIYVEDVYEESEQGISLGVVFTNQRTGQSIARDVILITPNEIENWKLVES